MVVNWGNVPDFQKSGTAREKRDLVRFTLNNWMNTDYIEKYFK